jgi:hypothetical protein
MHRSGSFIVILFYAEQGHSSGSIGTGVKMKAGKVLQVKKEVKKLDRERLFVH